MADKDHKKSKPGILFSSLRRSLLRTAEETRPLVRPTGTTVGRTPVHRQARFEISLRDKSDATAKRGFRVQVPKRMLSYALLIFVVVPLFLFGYMEVQTTHKHPHPDGHSGSSKAAEHHHHVTDVLSFLTDQDENEGDTAGATNSTTKTASVVQGTDTGNTTTIGDAPTANTTSELKETKADDAQNADTAEKGSAVNQTQSDEHPKDEKKDTRRLRGTRAS